jgi:hypothetical protein
MTLQEIAQAIKQIERSGLPLRNSYYNLNFWRAPLTLIRHLVDCVE